MLFTVFLGANDAVLPGWTDLEGNPVPSQHVPLQEYPLRLGEIVQRLREYAPNAEIVCITPPPVCRLSFLCVFRASAVDS